MYIRVRPPRFYNFFLYIRIRPPVFYCVAQIKYLISPNQFIIHQNHTSPK
ncbi:hypothetical protein Hdeb2414_s0076g00776331 [Helianthus debilis subsp. tardiflorus]